ncbi:MAG: choice-of-anchor Q domain-containing protein [Anaerolineales bacterium]
MSRMPNSGNAATPGSGGNACPANDQRGYYRPVDGDANGTARCDMGATEFGATAAIVYTYDPLNRLTRAQYPDNSFFAYTYDAVGNRLSAATITSTTVYTYDDANRLTNAGGVAYAWNANGNLLNDGVVTPHHILDQATSATMGHLTSPTLDQRPRPGWAR